MLIYPVWQSIHPMKILHVLPDVAPDVAPIKKLHRHTLSVQLLVRRQQLPVCLMRTDHGTEGLISQHFQQQRVFDTAIDDVHSIDTGFCGFER
jgi:hypothetical protein